MNGLERLTSKWWFRLAIIAGYALIMFILAISTMPSNSDGVFYANNSLTMLSVIFVNIGAIVMYFTTDILDNLHFKITQFLRKILLLASFVAVGFALLLGGLSYIINANNGEVLLPFFDGIGLAPFMSYAILYFFVVGKFEKVNEKEPNRLKQFILLIAALVAPIIVGIIIVLILKMVDNSTVSLIVLSALLAIFVLSFVFSIRKYGLYLGGLKEYEREKPAAPTTSHSDVTYGEWESKFTSKIEGYAYGTYTTVTCHAIMYGSKIEVKVKIDYYGSNDASICAKRINEIAKDVKAAYTSVAKNCPYSSKLIIE